MTGWAREPVADREPRANEVVGVQTRAHTRAHTRAQKC